MASSKNCLVKNGTFIANKTTTWRQIWKRNGNILCDTSAARAHPSIILYFVPFFFWAPQSGCGLLVTVIKSLDSSETNEERQKEKLKIEKEFKKTDLRLNDLVAQHDGDLSKVMQLFGQVSSKITTSRDKIHLVKTNLQECKKLLRCRRDELQKLWSDAMQQKYVAEMLDQV